MEETVLDDLKYIHERDAQDALGVAEKQWQQLDYDYKVDLKPAGEIRNIILWINAAKDNIKTMLLSLLSFLKNKIKTIKTSKKYNE